MKAALLQRDRFDFDDGTIVEMVIWKVPKPVEGSPHAYKYRLFFGRPGERIVGYDNERSKGDHRHIEGGEQPYDFKDVETLVRDFSRISSDGGRNEESDDSNSKEYGCRAQEDGRAVRQSVENGQVCGRHFGIRISCGTVSCADAQTLGADRAIAGTRT
ncbi:MAG TPA: DUF6516 family protein [Gammaproteobacteria bacterium]